MWQIIKNEWQLLSRTKLLLGISTAFIAVLIASILLGNYQVQKQQAAYQQAKDHVREKWDKIEEMNPHGAAHYGTYVFKPSNLLSSLDEGVNSVVGNVLKLEGHVQNEMVYSEASQMQAISKFGKLKSSLLLKYILPLLLIFLAFHIVSSERQSGRLKLLILQGAKPSTIIFGKTSAITLYGIGLLAIVILAHSLLNFQDLTSDLLLRTLLLFLSYSIYYFIICGLTVFFSARWKNPTVALTSMLGLWILWTIFLPNVLMSAVENWHPLPSRNTFKTAMKEDRSKGIDGHNPEDERGKELELAILKEYGVDSIAQLPINFSGVRMQADEEYGNQVWDKHFGNLREVLSRQKQSLQLGGIINPYISLQNASMGFASSDNFHHNHYLAAVESYRRGFIKTLNDKLAFGGSKTGDYYTAKNDFFKSIEDFNYQPIAIATALPNYLMDVGLLIFWMLAVIGLLLYGTKKMEIL